MVALALACLIHAPAKASHGLEDDQGNSSYAATPDTGSEESSNSEYAEDGENEAYSHRRGRGGNGRVHYRRERWGLLGARSRKLTTIEPNGALRTRNQFWGPLGRLRYDEEYYH